LAVFHQTRTADVTARRNDGRGRLQRGNASLGRTLLPEYPDITVYIEHLRSRISNEPLEEVRLASPFFLRSVDVPIGATKGKRVVELRRLGKRTVFALEDDLFLVLHLMIAGRLRWRPRGTKPVGKIALATFEFPKPAKPEPNRDFEHTPPSVVRAIFGCSADSHPPGSSRSAGANLANPMGSSHYGTSMIASSAFSGQ